MNKLSIKNMVIFAVVLGVIVGVGAGLAKSSIDNSPVAVADESTAEPERINPFGADHELGQIAGEHEQTWLIERALGGSQFSHSGSSSDPAFLRSRLEAQGIDVPEGATTDELRELLSGSGGWFDHSR